MMDVLKMKRHSDTFENSRMRLGFESRKFNHIHRSTIGDFDMPTKIETVVTSEYGI